MAAACSDDVSCSLAGHCVAGSCICDVGWMGDHCEMLRLGATSTAIHPTPSSWSWGGSPIVGSDGRWHLLHSYMINECGLLHYQTNSVVRHAVADSPEGPWRVTGTALAPRPDKWDSGGVHAPQIRFDNVSSKYLLFYEATQWDRGPLDCRTNRSVPAVYISASRRIGVAYSTSASGPWQRLDDPILAPRPRGHWDASDVSNGKSSSLTQHVPTDDGSTYEG